MAPQDLRLQAPLWRFRAGLLDLHARLQERGIDTLIISGTLSQVCCEATARDAMMMNYKVFFITDASATLTDAEHSGNVIRDGTRILRRAGYPVHAGPNRSGLKRFTSPSGRYCCKSLFEVEAKGT